MNGEIKDQMNQFEILIFSVNQQPYQQVLNEQYGAQRCPDDPGAVIVECGDSVREITFDST